VHPARLLLGGAFVILNDQCSCRESSLSPKKNARCDLVKSFSWFRLCGAGKLTRNEDFFGMHVRRRFLLVLFEVLQLCQLLFLGKRRAHYCGL